MEFRYEYEKTLPAEQVDIEIGETAQRGYRETEFHYHGQIRTLINPGWYVDDEDMQGLHANEDQKQYAININRAKAEIDGLLLPEDIRNLRELLGLTKEEAGIRLGGGHNGFGKYETGEILPSKALNNVLTLLQRDPEQLDNIPEPLNWN